MHRRGNQSQFRANGLGARQGEGRGISIAGVAGIALVSLFLLTGCGGDASPYAIPTAILVAVLKAIKRSKHLQFAFGEELPDGDVQKFDDGIKEDRHKGWFIFRRAELIGKRHTNFGEQELIPLVSAQFDQVVLYLKSKLDPGGPFSDFAESGGTSSAPPDQPFTWDSSHHLDLRNLATQLVNVDSNGRENEFLKQRQVAVRTIVWHAAGLHDEFWSQDGDGATLNQRALDEIVDRRLRSIERMQFQINGDGHPNRRAPGAGGRGPWVDDSRVRVYEYPSFASDLIDAADIGVIWGNPSGGVVNYFFRNAGGLVTRFDKEPDRPSPNWVPGVFQNRIDQYIRVPGPGTSIAASLEALFRPKLDVWERAWLFCDHSIASAHMEALYFALIRQGQGSTFDGLIGPKFPVLGGIFADLKFDANGKASTVDNGSLFADGVSSGPTDTGVFDDVCVEHRDLQVGDHVILFNHHLYVSVTTGAWRLENAFVIGLDVVMDDFDDANKLKPAVFMKSEPDGTRFSGFGETRSQVEFSKRLLRNVVGGFNAIYNVIPSVTGDAFIFEQSFARSVVLKWRPYPGIIGDPWFVFLQRVSPGDRQSQYPDVPTMHRLIKHSVLDDPDPGSDYTPFPKSLIFNTALGTETRDLTDGVLFPLYVPVFNRGEKSWDDYFEKRRDEASLQVTLRRLRLAPEMVPGLFVRGKDQPIQTIRPRVRP